MKILFITHFFPPFNSIGAVRTGKTAKCLVEGGHDVKVISCANQSLANNLALEIPNQSVNYTPWLNVNSPVEFLLGGRKKVAVKGFMPSAKHLPGFIIQMGVQYRNILNFPDGQVGWYPFAQRAGNRLISHWVPDIIFASAPPYTSLLIASVLSRKHNIPWFAELRDLWVDNHARMQPPWRKYVESLLESRVLSSACGLVTVSEPLREILKSKYSNPCEVISNGFDPEDCLDSPDVPFANGIVRIAYTGQFLSNCFQDPLPLIKALEQMGSEREKIRVCFYGRSLDLAYQRAIQHNVSHLIEIHEPVSHKDSVAIQAQSDILLLLSGQSPTWRGVYTGKLFEYIGARRPILCIGGTEGVAAKLIRERGAGIVLNDPESIAHQLRQWVGEKNDSEGIPFLPEDVGKGLTRNEQTDKLAKFFQSCLAIH